MRDTAVPSVVSICRIIAAAVGLASLLVAGDVVAATTDRELERLLTRMTLDEKLGQLTMTAGGWDETGPTVPGADRAAVRRGEVGAFLGVYGARRTRAIQTDAVERSRLGVPLLFAYDVIHGFRTVTPMPLAEAASWNPALVERSARLAAVEASAHGLHWTFAPMVDIGRDARWGRVMEGAGEDPYLGRVMAAARVRGFQGGDLSRVDTLAATAKHFAGYGAAEGGRDYDIADVSRRTLVETHLPPFRAAIDAGVATVMAAFNEVEGMPAHASRWLLDDVLRRDWGFAGAVVSDYNAIRELLAHGVAANAHEAGALALRAGVDIDMVGRVYGALDRERVREAQLMPAIDRAVRRVLRLKRDLGLFDDPYRYSDRARQTANTLTPASRRLARRLVAESSVLLENRNATLPLDAEPRRVAVIGPLADDPHAMLGGWSMAGRPRDVVTVRRGLDARFGKTGEVVYAAGAPPLQRGDRPVPVETTIAAASADPELGSMLARAARLARGADAVVLVVGETATMSAEASNRTRLGLPGHQAALVATVADAVVETGRPLITILLNGRPLAIPDTMAMSDAVLEAWHPGIEGGHAIAEMLAGDRSPAGRLPMSVPRHVGQMPLYYAHRPTGRPSLPGEPYRRAYLDEAVTPLYPFGYGLDYTDYAYSSIEVAPRVMDADGSVSVSVDVRNVGKRTGQEVVQLYLRDPVARRTRPVRELVGFRKVRLEPGEIRRVRFRLSVTDLAYATDGEGERADAGAFRVFVGGSSAATLESGFRLRDDWRASSPGSGVDG